jgi:Flp pilus assembly protein TadD
VFVFLAVTFAASFVLFGVGTGFGGLNDILASQSAGSGAVSADDAREAIKKNPNDAEAYRDLSRALVGDGKVEEAIPPLAKYVRLRPGDNDARRELAGLYLSQGDRWRTQAQLAQIRIQEEAPGQVFQPSGDSKVGQALSNDPITQARTSDLNQQLNVALTKMQAAYANAVRVFKQAAKAQPQDASLQLDVAHAAEAASDVPTAIAAYKAFLKLAPEDQSAGAVRERIKQLQASTRTGGG